MKILNAKEYINEKYQIKPLTKERLKEVEIQEPHEPVVATDDNIHKLVKDTINKYGINADLNFIDTSQVINMCGLFYMLEFNGDISQWDVSNVKTMGSMFVGSTFNGDISQWDVSNVEDMIYMFDGSKFNGDISKWNVSKVKDMFGMFRGCPLESNPPKWYKG